MQVRANVTTPWARSGEVIEISEPTQAQIWALNRGTLERVDDPEPEPVVIESLVPDTPETEDDAE